MGFHSDEIKPSNESFIMASKPVNVAHISESGDIPNGPFVISNLGFTGIIFSSMNSYLKQHPVFLIHTHLRRKFSFP